MQKLVLNLLVLALHKVKIKLTKTTKSFVIILCRLILNTEQVSLTGEEKNSSKINTILLPKYRTHQLQKRELSDRVQPKIRTLNIIQSLLTWNILVWWLKLCSFHHDA